MIRGDFTTVNVVVGTCFQTLLRPSLCLVLHCEFSRLFKHRGIAEQGLARDEVTELFPVTSACTERERSSWQEQRHHFCHGLRSSWQRFC